MNRAGRALALAAFALLPPAAVLAEGQNLADMVDDLQRMQLRVAQGDKEAYAAQFQQLKAIGVAVAVAKPETWKDKRQADSLVIYILSGGPLADVVPLLKGEAVLESERPLLRGALAYVTSHEADAIALLGKEDLTALDARLAGQIAFARSVLETKRDAKAAIELLDWTRLLAPGGLVEEAALRREIAFLAEAKDVRRVAVLTRQYSTRFAASLYAMEFLRDLARSVAQLGLADDPDSYQLLSGATAALPADRRQDFLLTLAKSAVVSARFGAAAAASTDALRGAPADSPEGIRARLYFAAARLFSDGYEDATAELRALAAAKLDPSDANLLVSARRVAAELRIAPDASIFNTRNALAIDDQKEKASGPSLTIEQAQDALQRTSALANLPEGGAP